MITCKKCGGDVEKHIPKATLKPGQKYYYAYYEKCKDCGTQFMPNDAKVYVNRDKLLRQAEIQAKQLLKTITQLNKGE